MVARYCDQCNKELSAEDGTPGVETCADCRQSASAEAMDPPFSSSASPRRRRSKRTGATGEVQAEIGRAPHPSRELAEPYSVNPFRQLRLPSTATSIEIMARYAEARVEAQLSSETGNEARLDELRRAQSELLDPGKRVSHEAGWFYQPPGSLYEGTVSRDATIIQGYRDGSLQSGTTGTQAKHDLANWLLLLACHKKTPGSIKKLALRALAAWSELLSDSSYTSSLPPSALSQRFDESPIWQTVVVGALAEAAGRRARSKDPDGVIAYLDAAKEHGAGDAELQRIANLALAIFSDEAHRVLKIAKENLETTPLMPFQLPAYAESMEDGQRPLKTIVVYLGRDLAAQYVQVLDEGALFVRQLSVEMHNKHQQTAQAVDLINRAHDMAASDETRLKIQGDVTGLRFQDSVKRALDMEKSGRWADARAAAQEASALATTDEDHELVSTIQKALAQRETQRQRSRLNRLALLGVGAVIAIVIAMVSALSGGSDPYVPTTSQPNPSSTSQSINSQSRSQLMSQINANKSRLSSMETQIDAYDSTLASYDSQMQTIKSRYPSLSLPEPAYTQYNNLVRQYNSVLASRNLLYSEYDVLFNTTNRLIDQYNSTR